MFDQLNIKNVNSRITLNADPPMPNSMLNVWSMEVVDRKVYRHRLTPCISQEERKKIKNWGMLTRCNGLLSQPTAAFSPPALCSTVASI